jgi:glycosyltransferase involved in cell wall biosynthesis
LTHSAHAIITAMTISIVIPVYNEEGEIAACLDAVRAQKTKPHEIIVVNNNSTDRTLEILEKYPEIKLIHEERQGVDWARDAGFNAATGDIIGRIDADTYIPPEWTTQLVEIFKDESIAAVTGPAYYKDMPSPAFTRWLDTNVRGAFAKQGDKMPFLFGTNMAVRRSGWETVRDNVCHVKTVHEDIDLGIHLVQAGLKVEYEPELVVGMSLRRVSTGPAEYYKYVDMVRHSYEYHGLSSRAMSIPSIIGMLVIYPGFHLVKRAYDPKTHHLSLKKFIDNPDQIRKNPMD